MSKIIKGIHENELVIKKSRFITTVSYISDVEDVNKIIGDLKLKYPKAVHYCYAYKIDNVIKYSDDGEPANTAGKPIYDVIDKQGLNNILIVVTRIFGGIKLGASGLVRAYTNATVNVLNNLTYYDIVKGYEIHVTCSYEVNDNVTYLLSKYDIIDYNKKFENFVIHSFKCSHEMYEQILEKLKIIDYKINVEIIKETNIIKEFSEQ